MRADIAALKHLEPRDIQPKSTFDEHPSRNSRSVNDEGCWHID
ncbi:MAG: hypothetical protein JWP89_802 [Schlesneria sp.]|nr:hypothetical protein [Schlesneria sp.]